LVVLKAPVVLPIRSDRLVARDETDLVVDARLRDQAISKPCSTPLGDEFRA